MVHSLTLYWDILTNDIQITGLSPKHPFLITIEIQLHICRSLLIDSGY